MCVCVIRVTFYKVERDPSESYDNTYDRVILTVFISLNTQIFLLSDRAIWYVTFKVHGCNITFKIYLIKRTDVHAGGINTRQWSIETVLGYPSPWDLLLHRNTIFPILTSPREVNDNGRKSRSSCIDSLCQKKKNENSEVVRGHTRLNSPCAR